MPTETHRAASVRIAGVVAHTTNASEMTPATASIPGLWARFARDRWADRLGSAGAAGPTIAAYSDYESDANGRYRLLVGRELPRGARVPAGLDVVEIPAGGYLVFQFQGALPQIVLQGWQQVWTFFEQPRMCRRAYTVDFEVYPDGGQNVEIWIAVDRTPPG